MNRDGDTYMLSHNFDQLLKNTHGGQVRTSGNTKTYSNLSVPLQKWINIGYNINTASIKWLSIDETVSEKM